jgi:hypothetical protein
MHEQHFKVLVPFDTFVDALEALDEVEIAEQSELHCLCRLTSGATVVVRPAYPDVVDVLVAGAESDAVAQEFARRLDTLVTRQTSGRGHLENA